MTEVERFRAIRGYVSRRPNATAAHIRSRFSLGLLDLKRVQRLLAAPHCVQTALERGAIGITHALLFQRHYERCGDMGAIRDLLGQCASGPAPLAAAVIEEILTPPPVKQRAPLRLEIVG